MSYGRLVRSLLEILYSGPDLFTVWTVSIAIGVLSYEVYGYFPSRSEDIALPPKLTISGGGICYYSKGLFGELMQFIPRQALSSVQQPI